MPKADTKQRKYWEEKVKEYKSNGNGKSQNKWCRENNISARSFNYWYCKFNKLEWVEKENKLNSANKDTEATNKQTNWIPIKIEDKEESNNNNNEAGVAIRIGKAKIEVNKGFDSESLFEVVKVMNLLC